MKFSYNILQTLVSEQLPDPKNLVELITMHSFETVIEKEFEIDSNIVVAKILKLEKHPGADRLRLATITTGSEQFTVVCGAPNISEGDIVPYAPPGSKVYDETGELFTLTVAKIRGVESAGMLNSARELGLSDNHGGIILLPRETLVGSKLSDHFSNDTILNIDVLPDRQFDASTHVGIAREISALLQMAMQKPESVSDIHGAYIQCAGLAEIGKEEVAKYARTIPFDPSAPEKVAGISINHDNVKMHLERLGFVITIGKEMWEVSIPSYRPDVLGQHNLVDEVIRLHGDGLDSIPPSDIVLTFTPIPVSKKIYWEMQIRKLFVELGFTETYSYSFEDAHYASFLNQNELKHVVLSNPMAPELANLRCSMLSNFIGSMMKNREAMHRRKKDQEQSLFEIGRVYSPGDGGIIRNVIEKQVVAGIYPVGETDDGPLFAILKLFGIDSQQIRSEVDSSQEAFTAVTKMYLGTEEICTFYVFHMSLLNKMKYNLPLRAFEISFNALLKHAPDVEIPAQSLEELRAEMHNPTQFTELPKYPSIFRDISVLVESGTSIDDIEQEINRVGGSLVVDVDLFDEFTAPTTNLTQPLLRKERGATRTSLSFHIEYRSDTKTLTDSEISEVHKKIEHTLKKEFDAQIR